MLPQFGWDRTYRFSSSNLAVGITIFAIGLFKKVAIADSFAVYASPVFSAADSGAALSFFQAWEGTFSYTLQLYFDFSGYSDMAIGLGRMFGIKLPLNFNAPYKSYNIIDFWRRWHMTLSRFLRDYLYFSLGGNRKGPYRRHLNLMVTMILGGLWHGAGWTFVAWGALHGTYLIVNHAWHKVWTRPINRWWSRGLARMITLLAVMVAWVFFRAETFDGAMIILSGMANLPNALHGNLGPLENILTIMGFGFDGGYLSQEYTNKFVWMVIWMSIIFFWPTTQQILKNYEPALGFTKEDSATNWKMLDWAPTARWSFVVAVISMISILHLGSISEFLYFQF
jgi:D-alanyl-lipoteichoic acid acyltransferase DltB (MBOAT superfamily)